MDALKESKKMTKGFKGKMFGAQALVIVAIWVCAFILGVFSAIPFIGGLFAIILFLLIVAVAIFCPIFLGLVSAKFYEDALHPAPQPMPQPQPTQYNFDPYTGQPINPQYQYGQPEQIPPTQPASEPSVQPIPPTQPAPVYNPDDQPVVNQNPTPNPTDAPTDNDQPERI